MNGLHAILPESQVNNINRSRLTVKRDQQLTIIEKSINSILSIHSEYRAVNTVLMKLVFVDCIFNADLNIGSDVGEIVFENCEFNQSVEVVIGSANFVDCNFNGTYSLHLNNKQKDFTIRDIDVKGKFEITGVAKKIIIENINYGNEIENQEVSISVDCDILQMANSKSKCIYISSNLAKSSDILNVETSSIKLDNLILGGGIFFQAGKLTKIVLGNVKGNDRSIYFRGGIQIGAFFYDLAIMRKLEIEDAVINALHITGQSDKDSVVNISKSSIRKLSFFSAFNGGFFSFRELKTPLGGLVSFKSSNLGKSDFIRCDFTKGSMEFENSKIAEAFLSESDFPRKIIVDDRTSHAQAQLVFGQLSTAFQKQGDSIRALEYASRELESHYQTIKWRSSSFPTKLSLWLNFISNNFGRAWLRGVLFSFSVGFLFFCLLLISTDRYSFGFPAFDLNLTSAYLKFMNPLRFFELEQLFNNTPLAGKIKLSGLSYIADFGGRIFVAYGYYQTIQAFRRFGRK